MCCWIAKIKRFHAIEKEIYFTSGSEDFLFAAGSFTFCCGTKATVFFFNFFFFKVFSIYMFWPIMSYCPLISPNLPYFNLTTICLYSPGPVPAGQLIEWEFTPTHS